MRKYMMIIMAVALMALPTMAQEQEQWKSTSIMSGAGGYTAPITEVGSASVGEMATTTGSAAKAPGAPRRGFIDPSNPGPPSNEDPIGDAVLPLALMALTFAGVVYFRKRKARV